LSKAIGNRADHSRQNPSVRLHSPQSSSNQQQQQQKTENNKTYADIEFPSTPGKSPTIKSPKIIGDDDNSRGEYTSVYISADTPRQSINEPNINNFNGYEPASTPNNINSTAPYSSHDSRNIDASYEEHRLPNTNSFNKKISDMPEKMHPGLTEYEEMEIKQRTDSSVKLPPALSNYEEMTSVGGFTSDQHCASFESPSPPELPTKEKVPQLPMKRANTLPVNRGTKPTVPQFHASPSLKSRERNVYENNVIPLRTNSTSSGKIYIVYSS